jgi:hypothetical protein
MNHNCKIIVVCNNINKEAKIKELGFGIIATTNQGCSKLLDSLSSYVNAQHTGCPTTYQTGHAFNNSNANDDIAKKFEQ